MPATPPEISTENPNLRLYPWYVGSLNAYFWVPVFFLYFLERVTLEQALLLESFYYICAVAMEVPSGYFSDRFGRRPTLLISAGSLFAASMTFYFGQSFYTLAIAQLLLATGYAFNSGTDTSLHFDSLAQMKREREFGAREALAHSVGFYVSAAAVLIGGICAAWGLRNAYALSAGASLFSFFIVWRMREPKFESHLLAENFLRQLHRCGELLRTIPALRWLAGASLLLFVFAHVPYMFNQPWIALLESEKAHIAQTPVVAGALMAVGKLFAGWAAARSIRLRDRWGIRRSLLIPIAMQIAIIAGLGLWLHPIVALLILVRNVPDALATAPLTTAIQPLVPSRQRATYLSLQSLAGRLAFSGLLLLLSQLAGDIESADWMTLSQMLLISAGLGALGLIILAWRRPTLPETAPSPAQPSDVSM